jgi:fibronectin type 3 domain-containing protein
MKLQDSPNHDNIQLQPLRIPTGWNVPYNNALYEVDPISSSIKPDDTWWIFKQDMLQMRHEGFDRLLDLGWCPEGDLENGYYKLVVYEGDFHGRLLVKYKTRDRIALVERIEQILQQVCDQQL